MANFCKKCGAPLRESAGFCPKCGTAVRAAVPPQAAVCAFCGGELKATSRFCPRCGRTVASAAVPQTRQPQFPSPYPEEDAQPKKRVSPIAVLIPAIALVLVAAILFTGFVAPGWILSRDGAGNLSGGNAGGASGYSGASGGETASREQLQAMSDEEFERYIASLTPFTDSEWIPSGARAQTAEVSPDRLTADLSGVSVELTEYVLNEGETAELSVTKSGVEQAKNGEWQIEVYDISLGEKHELYDFVTVRLPYDDSFIDPGEKAADCVAARYYDTETGAWQSVLYTVDEANSELVVLTDHFSSYGVVKVKNAGLRSAYLIAEANAADAVAQEVAAYALGEFVQNEIPEKETSMQAVGLALLDKIVAYGNDAMNVSSAGGLVDAMKIGATGEQLLSSVSSLKAVRESAAGSFLTKAVYKSNLSDLAGKALSRLGQAATIAKLTAQLVKRVSTGQELSTEEFYGVWKDMAFLAASFCTNPVVGIFAAACWALDYELNWMVSNMREATRTTYTELYYYFNEKYTGYSIDGNSYRPGRSAADWRKWIIDYMSDPKHRDIVNSETGLRDALEAEIDSFAAAFWTLGPITMENLANENGMSTGLRDASAEEIKSITQEYKQDLYSKLYPVMTSVKNYFYNKSQEQVVKERDYVLQFYNKHVYVNVIERFAEGEDSDEYLYANCVAVFAPLNENAVKKDWVFTLDDAGQAAVDFSLYAHMLVGSPDKVYFYPPGTDPLTDPDAKPVATGSVVIDERFTSYIYLDHQSTSVFDDTVTFGSTWTSVHLEGAEITEAEDPRQSAIGGLNKLIYGAAGPGDTLKLTADANPGTNGDFLLYVWYFNDADDTIISEIVTPGPDGQLSVLKNEYGSQTSLTYPGTSPDHIEWEIDLSYDDNIDHVHIHFRTAGEDLIDYWAYIDVNN